ncbi:PAS domain-containing sensor histidine kinase [Sulfoacidibacillus thermotolerans]|uniref:histidine kinase n=1 Tax=Sulfoacidibacillus thermotolerans TaxID=1765684 RepID=A0A2U3D7Q5_SULT2|nr:PAS domain-containing sensor histidine kinase [Sulfoacidibacillus thermotolerans]PWI57301.1 hypothetical protein BM613_09395 [Sulfoacidibacillus thermotolerans]
MLVLTPNTQTWCKVVEIVYSFGDGHFYFFQGRSDEVEGESGMGLQQTNQQRRKSIGRSSDAVYSLYVLNALFFLVVMGFSVFYVRGRTGHFLDLGVSVAYAVLNGLFFYLFASRNRHSKELRRRLGIDAQALDSVIEALYEGYYEVDLSGRIQAFNTSLTDILNVDGDCLRGRLVADLVTSDVAFQIMRAASRVYRKERSNRALPISYVRAQGQVISLEVSITLMRDKYGEKTGFRGIVRNVSERDRQERARAESEGRLRALLCAMPDMVVFKSLQQHWLEANQAALDLFGLHNVTYRGKTNAELAEISPLYHEKLALFSVTDQRAIDSGELIAFEIELPTGAHTKKLFEVRKLPVFDDRAQPIGILSIARDISVQRDMQKQLMESESRNRSFIEQLHDGVIWFDLMGTVLDANPASYAILGQNLAFIGSTIGDFVAEQDVRCVLAAYARACRGELQEGIYQVYHADGHFIDVYLRLSPLVMREDQVGVFGIFRDITEERRTRMELEDLSRKQHAILQSAGEGIYGLDLDGRITFCNASALAMTGYTEEEVIGRYTHEVFYYLQDGNMASGEKNCIVSLFAKEELGADFEGVKRCENALFWRKDGSKFYVDYIMSPMIDEGVIVGAVCLFNDVTERKHAEQLLMQSEKLAVVGQLAAGIVHEIRNPLTVLKGFLRFSENGNFKSEYISIMDKEIERIETIIQEFLILAKPQAMNLRWYDVGKLLMDALTPLQPFILQNNVTVELRIASPLPLVQCEEMQLRQAFMNILKNAIEAMPLGGHLTIEANVWDGRSVHVQIADDGCGIPEQQVKNLGTPFYTTKQNGTGLGLTVSQKIIELHHGTLQIKSIEGTGTIVELVIPIEHGERSVYASMGGLYATKFS